MFGNRFRLFSIAGFKISADVTWLFVATLIAWSLATGLFPGLVPGSSRATVWAMGVAGALGLFASVLVHELAHSIVARRRGTEIAGITLFLFGGVAEMSEDPERPRDELLIAAVGPLTSVAVGVVLLAVPLGLGALLPAPFAAVLSYVGWLNFLLAGFNLIPAFPLDGGRVLRAYLWERTGDMKRATRTSARLGELFGAALIALGVVALIVGNVVGGVWWAMIGLFLRSAARASYETVVTQVALQHEPVARFASREVIKAPAFLPLSSLVEDFFYRHAHKSYPVVEGDAVVGVVSTSDLAKAPRDTWDTASVRDVMQPLVVGENAVLASLPASQALRLMTKSRASRLVVLDDGGAFVGMLWLKDLMSFLQRKLEIDEAGETQAAASKKRPPWTPLVPAHG